MSQSGRHNCDELLALCLAIGMDQAEAARTARVSVSTIARRRRDPAFKAMVAEHRARLIDRVSGSLTRAAVKAVKTLSQLMNASNPPPTRRAAASDVLAHVLRLKLEVDDEERMRQLERDEVEAEVDEDTVI